MQNRILLMAISCLLSSSLNNYYIKTIVQDKELDFDNHLFKKNKMHLNGDINKDSNDSESNDENTRSGGDSDKYFELPVDNNGSFDLPEQADYSGSVGANLLKYVKPGDILYDSIGINFLGTNIGHVALIEGIYHSTTYNQDYIVTIESNPNHGVKRGYVDKVRFEDYKTLMRVDGTDSLNIASVLYFASEQIGKPYEFHFLNRNESINTSSWYCSELVWAA